MKTILRILMLGIFMTAMAAVGATSISAQDVCKDVEANQALYKKYTDNYAGTIDQVKTAIESGRQYIEKYGACTEFAEQVNYLKGALPEREAFVKKTQDAGVTKARYERFNTSAKAKNVADIYSSGKEILAKEPEFLDVIITLANAGFDQSIANPPVDTYNDDTINYSKTAIEKIEAGKTSDSYGVFTYGFKNDKFRDTKSNALGSLNYNIGYIMYYRQGKDNPAKKKEALPYFYKATQYNSASKTDPTVYQAIGAWYLEEAIRLDKQRADILKGNGNKDNEETLGLLGMQKGYADRAIDGYARAYTLAKKNTDPKAKTYTDALYTKLKELYAFRFEGKTDVDAYIATVTSKPLPDPTTEVTPVKEVAAPTTTATPSGTTTNPTSMTSDSTTSTQPSRPEASSSTTATTKTSTSGAGTKTMTTTTTKTKTVVKKPAPKKKGIR